MAFGKTEQKYGPLSIVIRDQRSEPAPFTFACSRDPLFDKSATKIGINQTTLNLADNMGERFVGKSHSARKARKSFRF